MTEQLRVNASHLALSEISNPFLRHIKFTLTDDLPNSNQMQVPYDEFENIKSSIIGMPIKMRFFGQRAGVGNHPGSIPIGYITAVAEEKRPEDGANILIADGELFADEYPDIMDFLDTKMAAKDPPGISWELGYEDTVVEQGISKLKGIVARAATFVRFPSYGKRTALLALASDTSLTDEEIEEEVTAIFKKEPEGGNEQVDLTEALARIAELEAENEKIKQEAADKDSEISTLTATASRVQELEASVTELTGKVTTFETSALIAERTNKVAEAGYDLDTDAAALEEKQRVWASMSDEVFDVFLSGISSVAKKIPAKKAEASARGTLTIPKVGVDTSSNGGAPASFDDLRSRMRVASGNPKFASDTE